MESDYETHLKRPVIKVLCQQRFNRNPKFRIPYNQNLL